MLYLVIRLKDKFEVRFATLSKYPCTVKFETESKNSEDKLFITINANKRQKEHVSQKPVRVFEKPVLFLFVNDRSFTGKYATLNFRNSPYQPFQ